MVKIMTTITITVMVMVMGRVAGMDKDMGKMNTQGTVTVIMGRLVELCVRLRVIGRTMRWTLEVGRRTIIGPGWISTIVRTVSVKTQAFV
jgi:hypothetical protein